MFNCYYLFYFYSYDDNGNAVLVLNEPKILEDMRPLTSVECAWDTLEYPRFYSSHHVVNLYVHEKNKESVKLSFEEEKRQQQVESILKEERKSKFEAWFNLCKHDRHAHNYTFEDIPKKYIFRDGEWRKRKREYHNVVGRIENIRPQNVEQYALRLLAKNRKGIKSFEQIKTPPGRDQPCATFAETAKVIIKLA